MTENGEIMPIRLHDSIGNFIGMARHLWRGFCISCGEVCITTHKHSLLYSNRFDNFTPQKS